MARAPAGTRRVTQKTRALVLRRVAYGESDLIVTLFTESVGRVSAIARAARKSMRRFGGALEPMHTLGVRFDERAGSELATLREATIVEPRIRLVSDLVRIQAAGRALGWVRHATPPRTPEPNVWRVIQDLLDQLNDPDSAPTLSVCLAEAGLKLLGALGWGLEFERCVRCGKACEPGRSATISPARGGLVCRHCGGARLLVTGPVRARLASAALEDPGRLQPEDAPLGLDLVDQALVAHAGLEGQ